MITKLLGPHEQRVGKTRPPERKRGIGGGHEHGGIAVVDLRGFTERHECLRRLAMALIDRGHARSEEHTSELQSRQYLVCRLLLEKKKTKYVTQLDKRIV